MWAKNIVHICMNISAGEKVLLVTDQAMAQMRERLMAEILTANPGQVWTYVLSDAQRPLVEYPPLLHQAATEVDAAMVFYSRLSPEGGTRPAGLLAHLPREWHTRGLRRAD